MVDNAYKQRLSEWITEQRRQLGKLGELASYNKLQTKITLKAQKPIDRATLANWERGDYKRPIEGANLEALAAYRNETPEQCRAWLNGKSEKSENNGITLDDVLSYISRSTSIVDLIEIVAKSTGRLQILTEENLPAKEKKEG